MKYTVNITYLYLCICIHYAYYEYFFHNLIFKKKHWDILMLVFIFVNTMENPNAKINDRLFQR